MAEKDHKEYSATNNTAVFKSPKPYMDNKEKLSLTITVKGKLPLTPSVHIYYWTDNTYKRTGKTEVVEVQEFETEITFTKKPKVDFVFEQHQNLKITLNNGHRSKKKEIGQIEFKLAQVISAGLQGLDLNFEEIGTGAPIDDFCSVNIQYSRLGGGNRVQYKVELKAFEVKDVDWFSSSDPFLKIMRPTNDFITEKDPANVPEGEWLEVIRTEHKDDDLNPNFKPFLIDGKDLCRGMENTALKMEIWDKGFEGVDANIDRLISIGYFSVYSHLVPKKDIPTYDKEGVLSGTIIIERFERRDLFSMIQHINYGLTFNLVASIDLTASNGNPKNPSSLHYIDHSGKKNQYQQAISQVFTVLEPYDTDKLIPVYGFGGMSPALGYTQTSHRFPLNGNESDPNAWKTEGVLQLYEESLPKMRLSGPTYFAPTIRCTIDQVREPFEKGEYSYTVLLILTDGTICDLEETYRAIEDASKLPISIIIVGVGDEDFSQMKSLDGDNNLRIETQQSERADEEIQEFKPSRDIVQFVSYRKFKNNPDKLAKEVLSEIPDQVSYFYWMITHRKGIFQ